jgi:hypothetical protein
VIAADGSATAPVRLIPRGNRPEFAADGRWMLLEGGPALRTDTNRRGQTGAMVSPPGPPPPGSRGGGRGAPIRLWLLDTHEGHVKQWLGTDFLEESPRFAPNGGHWVAYVSNSTGSADVWARRFPGPGAPIRVSNGGGREPVWSPDGKQLFYQGDGRLMAADVKVNGAEIQFGPPQVLFEGGFRPWEPGSPGTYDVAADGRFLMITPEATVSPNVQRIAVVLNWGEELKRRVAAKN